MVKERKKEV